MLPEWNVHFLVLMNVGFEVHIEEYQQIWCTVYFMIVVINELNLPGRVGFESSMTYNFCLSISKKF